MPCGINWWTVGFAETVSRIFSVHAISRHEELPLDGRKVPGIQVKHCINSQSNNPCFLMFVRAQHNNKRVWQTEEWRDRRTCHQSIHGTMYAYHTLTNVLSNLANKSHHYLVTAANAFVHCVCYAGKLVCGGRQTMRHALIRYNGPAHACPRKCHPSGVIIHAEPGAVKQNHRGFLKQAFVCPIPILSDQQWTEQKVEVMITNKLAPYGTYSRLLLTADFKVTWHKK